MNTTQILNNVQIPQVPDLMSESFLKKLSAVWEDHSNAYIFNQSQLQSNNFFDKNEQSEPNYNKIKEEKLQEQNQAKKSGKFVFNKSLNNNNNNSYKTSNEKQFQQENKKISQEMSCTLWEDVINIFSKNRGIFKGDQRSSKINQTCVINSQKQISSKNLKKTSTFHIEGIDKQYQNTKQQQKSSIFQNNYVPNSQAFKEEIKKNKMNIQYIQLVPKIGQYKKQFMENNNQNNNDNNNKIDMKVNQKIFSLNQKDIFLITVIQELKQKNGVQKLSQHQVQQNQGQITENLTQAHIYSSSVIKPHKVQSALNCNLLQKNENVWVSD
ncbi:hypothetical protein PPERSA_04940 [Pseudocohnilembus persalinus]|uniref:Uncharacterized protein n=1 Tax=Pseudocohnilembus persalinus TaxID=266149 RepID=A0A0V0QWK2_PSEPJ|nr:hypothetical protein PPERSA_04940 [Pseudocohnilembus persalinus]|eukprot:KRX06328.1 hypothetical protein PPERSA_04940 [Pseudocohnilembus persalinus]